MQKHVQRLALLAAMMLLPWLGHGQVLSEYTLTTDTTTFTSIATTGTAISLSSTDDGYGTVSLPFAFHFGESSLPSGNSICVGSNGYILLTGTSGSTTVGWSTATQRVINAAIAQDAHMARYTGAGCYYQLDTVDGVQCFTIEFHLLAAYSTPYGVYSHQIKLYENGNIEFVYDSVNHDGATSRTMRTFLWDGPTGDLAVITGPWATPTLGATMATRPTTDVPAHGLRYTLTRPIISCPKPTSLAASNFAPTGFDLAWTDTTDATSWVVTLDDGTTTTADLATTNSYSFTGLSSSTSYTVSVSGICLNGDTSMARSIVVRTPCVGLTDADLPYTETFESYNSGSSYPIDSCWVKGTNGTTPYPYPYSTNAITGTRSLYFYSYMPSSTTATSYYSYAALPMLDPTVDITGLTLSFKLKTSTNSGSYYSSQMHVGVMTDPYDISTFETVAFIDHTGATPGTVFVEEVNFANYTGTGRFIALFDSIPVLPTGTTYAYSYCYVDDVTLAPSPTCMRPENLTATANSDGSVDLTWHDPSNASQYVLSYGRTGSTDVTVVSVYDTTYTLGGLAAGVGYTWSVYGICSATDSSTASSATFTAPCVLITAANLPMNEDFEAYGSGSANPINGCWYRGTNSSTAYPYPSGTNTVNGLRSLYFYSYRPSSTSTTPIYSYVALPEVDSAQGVNTLTLQFNVRTYSTASLYYNTQLHVGVMTDPTDITTFQTVEFVDLSGATALSVHNIVVDFANYTGNGRYIAIYDSVPVLQGSASYGYGYCYVDDINLALSPSCARPSDLASSNITMNSVDLEWTGDLNATSYTVVYGPNNGTDTTIEVFTNSVTLTELVHSTTYHWSVYSHCSAGDSTLATTGAEFTTSCGIITADEFPVTYGFEDATANASTGTISPCWHKQVVNYSTQYPYPSSAAHSGAHSLYFYSYSGSNYESYVCTPMIATSWDSVMVTFWNRSSSTTYSGNIRVGTMSDPTDRNTFHLWATCTPNGTTWTYQEVPMGGCTDTGRYICFLCTANGDAYPYNYAYLDDITIDFMPACYHVMNLEVTGTSAGGAVLDWDASPSDLNAEYTLQVKADTSLTWDFTYTGLTETNYTLSGLTPGTAYTARVAALCNYTDSSEWETVSFSTIGFGCVEIDTTTLVNATVNTGTSSTSNVPVNSGWGNTLCQSIYPASELVAAGLPSTGAPITDITFTWTTVSSYPKVLTVYMANTSQSTYPSTSTSYWVATGDDARVLEADITTGTSGAVTYHLDNPFMWDGSNLAITTTVNQPTGASHTYSGFYGYSTSVTGNRSMYKYQDSNPLNGAAISTIAPSGCSAYVPTISLRSADCARYATCAAPTVAATHVTSDSVVLTWAPGFDETDWDVSISTDGGNTFTFVNNTTDLTYTFDNLQPATNYTFRVATICTPDTFAADIEVRTECADINTIFEDFNSYVTGSASSISPCWYKAYYTGSTTTYPYPYSLAGNTCMYFYSYRSGATQYYSYMAAPRMIDSLSVYEVEFDIRKYTTTVNYISQIVVGAMSDPANFSTFDSITTVTANAYGTWENAYVSLENYHDTSKHYIAFLAPAPVPPAGYSYAYGYVYVDNVYIGRRSSCPRPSRVHAREITNNSADIAWDGSDDHMTATVKWGTINSEAAATDSVDAYTNFVSLTTLNPSTTYYVWVTANCAEETSRTYSCSFTTADPCDVVADFRAAEVTNTTATFAWTGSAITPADSYTFEWKADSASVWNSDTTSNSFYFLAGLAEGVAYSARVYATCGSENSSNATVNFTTSAVGTIGTNEGYAEFPTYPHYNHSISEQLWTANELAVYGDTINGIYFYSGSAITGREMEIYVGNTTLTNLSTSNYVSSANMTLVYSNTNTSISAGWNEFHFDTAFVRNPNQSLVVMCHDVNDYEAFNGWAAGTSSINTLYGYDDDNDFSTTNLSGLESAAARAVMRLNATIQTPTCVAPHPVVAGTTGSSIDIAWMPGANETAWLVEYRKLSETAWTALSASVTDTFASINGLDASTAYIIRVGALCTGDTTFGSVQGYTACGAFSVPYLEDYNSYSSGDYVMNNCWTKGVITSNAVAPSTVNVTGQGMCMVMPLNSYVILPEFSEPINTLQLRTDFIVADTNIYALVGVCSYPGDYYTMTVVDTLWAHTNGVAEQKIVKFDNYEGSTGSICIFSGYNNTYYDNIRVELIPSCQQVDSISLENVTDNMAVLAWVAGSNASSFIVEYGKAGDTAVSTVTTTTSNVTLTGLDHSTTYWMHVIAVCAAMNDTSLPTNNFTFMTNCMPVTLPYYESFDSCNAPALDYTGVLPNCWTANYLGTGTYTMGTYRAQIYRGASYASSGTMSLRLCGAAVTTLPEMPVDVNNLQIRFHDYNTSTSYYGLIIGVCDSNALGCEASFVPVDTINFTAVSDWYTSYRLASYTGTGRYIAFKNYYTTSSTVYYSYNYIDDITIDTLPSCLPVMDVHAASNTSSSIDLTWTDLQPATEWEVSYATAPLADPATGITAIATTKPYSITGLSDSMYYFYVRTVCGAGDTSIWSNAFTCRPGTWVMRANQTDTLTMCSGHIYDDGGPDGVYSNSQESVIILMPQDSNYRVRISGTLQGEGCCDYFGVYDGIGISAPQLMYNYGSNLTIGPFESTSGPLTIRFHSDGSVNYPGFDVTVECIYDGCRVDSLRADSITGGSLNVVWSGSAAEYEVEYGNAGFALGTGTNFTVTTNSALITGLSSMTTYDVYVRGICGGTDTGSFRQLTVATAMCDNPEIATNYGTTPGTATQTYIPGYSFFNYSYSQVIVDSADLAGLTGDITAFEFQAASANYGTYFDHCDLYMAHTNLTALTGFVQADSNFVEVAHDVSLSFTEAGWVTVAFANAFTWDGHSNVIFAVNRRHGTYSSGASFSSHTGRTGQGCYVYSDGSAYNPASVSGGTTTNLIPNYRFISCNDAPVCARPVITGETHDYESATITWSGSGNMYQVAVKSAADAVWPAETTVAGNTYTFTGLSAATDYAFRVRQDCTADSIGYSEWSYGAFTTDSLPCFAPSTPVASNITNAEATITWTANGAESNWEIHVWALGISDQNFTVTTNPATVNGLIAGVTYNMAVRALCGSALVEGDWSDTATFTTLTCPDVTGLATSNVTFNSVDLSWNTNPMAQSWIIEYGFAGFNQGQGTTVNVTTNSYSVTNLTDETNYDFYVRAVCGSDWTSENWAHVSATTAQLPEDVYTVTLQVNDPAMGTVSGAGTYAAGTSVTISATPYEGYQFDNWSDGNTEATRTLVVNDNITLTAYFSATQVEGIDQVSGATCTIYPNPATSSTTINVAGVNGKVRISVVDMNGRVVATDMLECNADCVKTMDVDNLAQGAYFVRITGENVNMVKKLVVR